MQKISIILLILFTQHVYANHELLIQANQNIRSIYIQGKEVERKLGSGKCFLNFSQKKEWVKTNLTLEDNSHYRIIGYHSTDCSSERQKYQLGQVPSRDNLKYLWVSLI
jgi:hypothetical protein